MAGSKETTTVESKESASTAETTLPQTKFYKEQYLPELSRQFGERVAAPSILPSQTLAAESALTTGAREQALAAAPTIGAGFGRQREALEGQFDPNQFVNRLGAAAAPGIEDIIEGTRQKVSALTDASVGAGQTGSTRQGIAQGIIGQEALRGTEKTLASILPSLISSGVMSSGQAQSMFSDALTKENLMAAEMQSQIGAQEQARAQQELEDIFSRAKFTNEEKMRVLGEFQQLANIQAGGTNVASGTASGRSTLTTPGPSGLEIGLGVATAAAPFLFSDIRLKKNIKYIGDMNGHRFYAFDYIWGGPRTLGVMAQEVMKYMPQAVKSFGEFLAVNYRMILGNVVNKGQV